VKLEFIAGLMMQALEATGTKDYRGQQVRMGEVVAYRNLFWSLSEAMARNATPWVNGAVLPAISGDLLSAVISIRYILGFRKDNPNVFNMLVQNLPNCRRHKFNMLLFLL